MGSGNGKGRINVLFAIIQMKMGGAERLVYNLSSGMDPKRFAPSVLYFIEGDQLRDFEALGIPIHRVEKRPGFDFQAMREIAKIIRKNNVHVVNAHLFMPFVYCFYGCRIANRSRLLFTAHSDWELRQLNRRWSFAGHLLLQRTDRAIGVSENVRKALQVRFGLSSDRTATILNAVPVRNKEDAEGEFELKRSLGIEDGCKVIGSVANFRAVKNHLFLLEVFNMILKEMDDVKLLLIGQGFEGDPSNTEGDIRRYIAERELCDRVVLAGYREDVDSLMGIMDILCLPSVKEGLPMSLIEGMVNGLPLVGTDVEGIRDVIEDGRNGFLVDLNDCAGFKNVLMTLLKDECLRKRLGDCSRAMAKEKYSIEKCISEYQELFASRS